MRSQQQRLVDAMVELATHSGYNAVTVTELCAHAGVSPASFYEHFAGKEECFRAAYVACAGRTFARLRSATADSTDLWEGARAALGELLGALKGDPQAGRLLFIEALGAGPSIASARKRVLEDLAAGAQALVERAPRDADRIDVPLIAVIGALRRIISRHLRASAEDELPALLDDGMQWLRCYAVAADWEPWSTSRAALLEDAPRPRPATWAAEPLPPGTHGLSPGVVARSQRTRLINATAEIMMAKGYQDAKITDIVAAARVAKPVFHAHFASKEQAFLEAQEHPTQLILQSCAQAYFSADTWPQRMWRMLTTLIDLVVSNPAISHLRLVECYAAGPAAIRRAEEVTRSFTIFLEEGYRQRPQGSALPRLCSDAVAGAIFEIVQRLVAAAAWAELPRYVPQLTYVAIAPFMGAQEASRIVEELKALKSRQRRFP